MNHHAHYRNFRISCFTFIFLSLQRHFFIYFLNQNLRPNLLAATMSKDAKILLVLPTRFERVTPILKVSYSKPTEL